MCNVLLSIQNTIWLLRHLLVHYLCQVDSLNDRKDFDNVRNAMKVLGYTPQEIDTVWKLIAAILHLVCEIMYIL